MKRLLPVLLGALAGAIGLPLLMWTFQAAGSGLFLRMSAPPISLTVSSSTTYQPFINSNSDLRVLVVGIVLGVLSIELWRSERTFWPRFGSALGAASVFVYFVWNVAANYRDWNLVVTPTIPNPTTAAIYYLPAAAFYLSPVLWSLALFFFAVLARRKPLLP